jgi:hypothetical protein
MRRDVVNNIILYIDGWDGVEINLLREPQRKKNKQNKIISDLKVKTKIPIGI